jgi:predicted amidophosphoribosyltransferase
VTGPAGRSLAELAGGLADLVLPGACAGCGAERVPLTYAVCAGCAAVLEALTPHPCAPAPPPPGLPPCTAVGPYGGPLRGVLLAYKERGGPGVPLTLVPVPSTARATRERHGDHMSRLCTHAVRRLRRAGWDAHVTRALRAGARPDSASLDTPGRVAAAESSLRIRPARTRILRRDPTMRRTLVVVDDIVTTGATLATVTARLREANVQVTGAAVLAATQLRRTRPSGS